MTEGCFDRLFWNYKITDFPSIWMQDGALLLALLYKRSFADNKFCGKKTMVRWVEKSVAFWLDSLHGDGSGDEVYPYERSFCATAFSAAAVAEAILLTELPSPEKLSITSKWLAKNYTLAAANQVAAAALALEYIARLLQEDEQRHAAEKMVHILLGIQHRDGYFSEYGGFDIGYLSITLSLLARLDLWRGDERIRDAARRAIAFLEARIGENGTYDNSDCSRGTQFLYPFGFIYFKSDIADKIIDGLENRLLINPAWLDDRYVIPMTIDYLLTHLYMEESR